MEFVFKTDWLEAISMLKPEQQAEAIQAIITIVNTQEMPETDSFEVRLLLRALFSEIVDGCNSALIVNTNKGGAPKGNKNASKKQPKQPKTTETTQNNVVLVDSGCFSEKERDKEPSSPTPPLTETEKEKEKENINYVDIKESEKERFSPSPSTALLPVSELEDAMMSSEAWVESMLYKFKLDKEQLAVQLHGFVREWIERGDDYKTLKDAKRHADALLRIRDGDGALAAAPHWNQFLFSLAIKYADELGYDNEQITAFGKYYMQDVGNGKPFFLGIPKFEENLYATMKAFKAEYKSTEENECTDEPRSRSKPA